MAIQFWKDLSILVGTIEVAGNAKNVNIAASVTELDTTALSTTGWTTLVGGLKSGTVSMELMADFVDDGLDETLQATLGATTIKSFCTASADGSVAYTAQSLPINYVPVTGTVGELAMANLSGVTTGPLVRGTLLWPSSAARTTSGTGTARQIGALTSAQTMYAALHVIAASGSSPTLAVKLQSDNASGFPSATDQITFATATGRTAEWKSKAGPVTDDWWRVSFTIGGSTPSFTFAVIAGISA
jgi:hypothetical protein